MSNSIPQLLEDSIFRVGKVISVRGRTVEIRVDSTKNTSNLVFRGDVIKNIAVGGYIKIAKGFTFIVGKVDGEQITEDRLSGRPVAEYGRLQERIHRILTVSLLGFFDGLRFERGIKELPLIDNECFLLHHEEFERVHHFVSASDVPLTIGSLAFEKGQDIQVGVDSLFASHVGIFGNTGSGKSYTLAKIYRELFIRYLPHRRFRRNATFFIIDFNGEYASDGTHDAVIVDRRYKNTYRLSTRNREGRDKFPLPEAILRDLEFWSVFLEATDKVQKPFLRRAIDSQYLSERIQDSTALKDLIGQVIFDATVESDRNVEKTVVVNFLKELSDCFGGDESLDRLRADYQQNLRFFSQGQNSQWVYGRRSQQEMFADNPQFRQRCIDAKVAELDLDASVLTVIDTVRLQIILQYFGDTIRGFANREHLAPLIKRLDRRVDDIKKVIEVREPTRVETSRCITVVSLKDVNMQMRKVLPLLFCKMLYEAKKEEADDRKYLNLIVDEAHNILSEQSDRESEQWKDYRLETFEEIIKEGRKFGTFLTIASQRPADISPTIISQLHNYFLHRLINNEDLNAVRQTISYLDKVSFDALPILPTGTCILAGILANVPVVIDIAPITPVRHEPRNKTMTLTDKWQ